METLKMLLPKVIKAAQEKTFEITEMPRKQAEEIFAQGLYRWLAKANAHRPAGRSLNFVMDEEYEEVVSDLIDYFRFSITGKYDICKGLRIAGNPGSRKTSLMEIFAECRYPGREINVKQNFCQYLTERYIKEGFDGIEFAVKPTYRGIYDDLGVETKGKYFGNELMVLSHVIQQTYKLWLQGLCRPIFTTNLTSDEIETIYDVRAESRLCEMCNTIKLGHLETSKDWRKA